MQKCHCGEVFFEEIVKVSKDTGKHYRQVMEDLGAGQICTSCIGDMVQYCEGRLYSLLEAV
jgi:bacterioferritin-associated ferredoxin